jgi:C4-dicarboxylate-specific signal transduction histidine kinase
LHGKLPSFEIDFRFRRKDESYVWILSRGAALRDEQGKPFRFAGSHTDITARKDTEQEVERLHKELLLTSRQAGMAEVASGVLHNVGNVLNSVNVSVNMLNDCLGRSQAGNLAKACSLIDAHLADLGSFFTMDPKGKRVPEFLSRLAVSLAEEHEAFSRELQTLSRNVEHIKEIVAMQQSYAKVAGVLEDLPAPSLVEDALRMNAGAFLRHSVHVKREYQDVPAVRVDRHKVLQILINLFRNAKYAMDAANPAEKVLTIGVALNGAGRVKILVRDNGIGIVRENLTRIFSHGFTTKGDGHGFGLHSGALAAKEMGGSLEALSDGPHAGATFILELPIAPTDHTV